MADEEMKDAEKVGPPPHTLYSPSMSLLTHVSRNLSLQDAAPVAKASGSAPRFEIKKWNAVAMWSWDICADTVRYYHQKYIDTMHTPGTKAPPN
eukprot:scaffold221_cov120-Cylindrotheca_fusiformis.AAC.6